MCVYGHLEEAEPINANGPVATRRNPAISPEPGPNHFPILTLGDILVKIYLRPILRE